MITRTAPVIAVPPRTPYSRGMPPPAKELNPQDVHVRLTLAGSIMTEIRNRGLTPTQVREQLGLDDGNYSFLRNSKIERFSIGRLIDIADRLGLEIAVSVTRAR